MKFRILALIITTALALSACSTENDNGNSQTEMSNSTHEVKYTKTTIDWEPYTFDELMSISDIVVVGKVTDISFMTHDDMSYPPPEIKKDKVLCTVYDIKVSNVYKGNVGDDIKLKMSGGLEDATYIDEQVAVLGYQPITTISICVEEPKFEIDQTYLLVLKEYEDFAGFYYTIGYYQGAYQIDSELEESENSLKFSVKNIISYFGEDKWNEFKASGLVETE